MHCHHCLHDHLKHISFLLMFFHFLLLLLNSHHHLHNFSQHFSLVFLLFHLFLLLVHCHHCFHDHLKHISFLLMIFHLFLFLVHFHHCLKDHGNWRFCFLVVFLLSLFSHKMHAIQFVHNFLDTVFLLLFFFSLLFLHFDMCNDHSMQFFCCDFHMVLLHVVHDSEDGEWLDMHLHDHILNGFLQAPVPFLFCWLTDESSDLFFFIIGSDGPTCAAITMGATPGHAHDIISIGILDSA